MRQAAKDFDIQFWDNQDGTWTINTYTEYARSKIREGQQFAGIKFSDAQMLRILLWALCNEMIIDGPWDLTINYLNSNP
jgi:hypothetical protein